MLTNQVNWEWTESEVPEVESGYPFFCEPDSPIRHDRQARRDLVLCEAGEINRAAKDWEGYLMRQRNSVKFEIQCLEDRGHRRSGSQPLIYLQLLALQKKSDYLHGLLLSWKKIASLSEDAIGRI